MRAEQLIKAIDGIDDKFISEADEYGSDLSDSAYPITRSSKQMNYILPAAAAAVVMIVLAGRLSSQLDGRHHQTGDDQGVIFKPGTSVTVTVSEPHSTYGENTSVSYTENTGFVQSSVSSGVSGVPVTAPSVSDITSGEISSQSPSPVNQTTSLLSEQVISTAARPVTEPRDTSVPLVSTPVSVTAEQSVSSKPGLTTTQVTVTLPKPTWIHDPNENPSVTTDTSVSHLAGLTDGNAAELYDSDNKRWVRGSVVSAEFIGSAEIKEIFRDIRGSELETEVYKLQNADSIYAKVLIYGDEKMVYYNMNYEYPDSLHEFLCQTGFIGPEILSGSDSISSMEKETIAEILSDNRNIAADVSEPDEMLDCYKFRAPYDSNKTYVFSIYNNEVVEFNEGKKRVFYKCIRTGELNELMSHLNY